MFLKHTLFKALSLCVLTAFCSVTLATGAIAEEPPRISHNDPQVTASEPEPIPVVTESKMPTWAWWVLAGVAAAGGGAVALAGGKGGGGSTSPPPASSSSGSSTVTW